MGELAGRTIGLGPVEDEETNGAPRAAVAALKFATPAKWSVAGSIDAAALAMSDGEADAAVVPAFLPPLLEGCGKLDKGSYDSAGIGGWNPKTGPRLWEVIPPDGSDFNVTTPVITGRRILLATENNATRLCRFDGNGKLVPEPVLKNSGLAPDTCTPAIARGRVLAAPYGELFCLDLENGLKTIWRQPSDMFHDHSNIVAGGDRILIWTASGDLLLLDAGADEYRPVSHVRPFEERHPDSLAHPAVAGDRI